MSDTPECAQRPTEAETHADDEDISPQPQSPPDERAHARAQAAERSDPVADMRAQAAEYLY